MKLLTKSLLLIAILFVVLATAVSMLSARVLYTSLTAEYQSKGIAIVQGVVDAGTETLLNRDLATVQAAVDEFASISGVAYVFVTDRNNEIISHTFVPAVPVQVNTLIQRAATGPVSGKPETTRLQVDGFDEVLHIHAPMLAGAAGFSHVGMDLGFINAQIRKTIIQQQLLIAIIFLFVSIAAFIITRRIARPITLLADYTRKLSEQDFSAELRVPDEIQSLPSRSRDEIGQLAQAHLDMEHLLQKYLADLQRTTAAKNRIESELNIAHDIQMSLVPRTFPPFPQQAEFELHASLVPAREVGGDFYDFFFVNDQRLCIAVADVSDKGVPASLFMALTRTLLRAIGREAGTNPAAIMTRLNREISEDNDSCMFVTAFCAFLDTRTGELEYCNAGHNLPGIVQNNQLSALPGTAGIALGLVEDLNYQSAAIKLVEGDLLFLYTDGITEAMDVAGEQFGWDRLADILATSEQSSCARVVDQVVEAVHEFADGAPQSDDMTLLALRYQGCRRERLLLLELLAGSEATNQKVKAAWEALIKDHELSEPLSYRGRLALEELITNISNYGLAGKEAVHIVLRIDRIDGRLDFELRDDGRAFDPSTAPTPNTSLSLEERQPGGLGLHLVRTMVQSFRYHRAGNQNVVNFSLGLEPDMDN